MHVTLIWHVDCTFPRLPTWIMMRIDAFASDFFSPPCCLPPLPLGWWVACQSHDLMGPPKAATWGASRCGGWSHISDDIGVRHVWSCGGRTSGRGGRIGGRHRKHDSPSGVGSNRSREKGDKWDEKCTVSVSCQDYMHTWIHTYGYVVNNLTVCGSRNALPELTDLKRTLLQV